MSQRVIITAAASGIGRVIVEAFVAQGARVHLCDVNDDALAEVAALSPSIVATRVDLADADALVVPIEALVSFAGITRVFVVDADVSGDQ